MFCEVRARTKLVVQVPLSRRVSTAAKARRRFSCIVTVRGNKHSVAIQVALQLVFREQQMGAVFLRGGLVAETLISSGRGTVA